MDAKSIENLVEEQNSYFLSGATMDVQLRRSMLQILLSRIKQMEQELYAALQKDLGKGEAEAYITELALVYEEIAHLHKRLPKLAKRRRVASPLAVFPAKSFVVPEPYGVCLIMSPWNYPVQLTLIPLAAAIAAGNCAVVKPSSYAPNVSRALAKLLSVLPAQYVCVVEGGREENQALLEPKFDFVFFTGGGAVGRQVLHAAAERLTPVVLELGGKSPVIVLKDADIDAAAKRILFGKILNAGQTCVAPDYVLVEKAAHEALVQAMQKHVKTLCPAPFERADYPHIVNKHHFDRLCGLLQGDIVIGGDVDEHTIKIEPTVIDFVTPKHPSMEEEIFGPVLPIVEVADVEQAIAFVRQRPSPLALYVFTKDDALAQRVMGALRFGGGCVNDCVLHLTNPNLPFGGVGESGMGSYHGDQSFFTFSHEKSILRRSPSFDFAARFMPFTPRKFRFLKRFMG